MGQIWDRIRDAIHNDRIVIGVHAAIRLRQRRIPVWQAISTSLDARLLAEHPDALPNPTAEIEILLADGVDAKAVWAWLSADASAKLVTVHFFDE